MKKNTAPETFATIIMAREAINATTTRKNHYSDKELEEFKQIILKKLEKAKGDLKILIESYTFKNEHDISDTSPTFKILEEGYRVHTKEENGKFAERQEKFIRSLENALIRIENKTYGICRITGNLIPADRLRSVPHATTSIEGKRIEAQKCADIKKNGRQSIDDFE